MLPAQWKLNRRIEFKPFSFKILFSILVVTTVLGLSQNGVCVTPEIESGVNGLNPFPVRLKIDLGKVRIAQDEGIPLTISIMNNSSLPISIIRCGALNISVLNLFRNGKPLKFKQPTFKKAELFSPRSDKIQPGKVFKEDYDLRSWQILEKWKPGKYRLNLNVKDIFGDLGKDSGFSLGLRSEFIEFSIVE